MCSPYKPLYNYGLPKDIINIINVLNNNIIKKTRFCFSVSIECSTCEQFYCNHELSNIKICAGNLCDKTGCSSCYHLCNKCKQEYFCGNCYRDADIKCTCCMIEDQIIKCCRCNTDFIVHNDDDGKDITYFCSQCILKGECNECGELVDYSYNKKPYTCKQCNKLLCYSCSYDYKGCYTCCDREAMIANVIKE